MIDNVLGYQFATEEERTRPRPHGQLTTALNPPDWPEQVLPEPLLWCGHPASALRWPRWPDRTSGVQETHWCGMCVAEAEQKREDDGEND
jgi:hypothetical protein